MKALIVYASRYGNTRQFAETIGTALRDGGAEVRLADLGATASIPLDGTELLIVAGPTEGHQMTPAVRAFLDGLDHIAVRGLYAAAFDTRLDWPRWLAGSAAAGIAKRLRELGTRLVVPPESFVLRSVSRSAPDRQTRPYRPLPPELARAAIWARSLAEKAGAVTPTPVAS